MVKDKTISEKIKYYNYIFTLIGKRIEDINKYNENAKIDMMKLIIERNGLQKKIKIFEKDCINLEIVNLLLLFSLIWLIFSSLFF